MSASAPPDAAPSVGALYVIGGAEDKLKRRTVLRHFVEASGGTRSDDRSHPDRVVART